MWRARYSLRCSSYRTEADREPPGDNSGSHRASAPAVLQAPSARITAGDRLGQLHPDSPRPPSESHGMQEVWGSNPHSSTGQRLNWNMLATFVLAFGTHRARSPTPPYTAHPPSPHLPAL